MLLPDEETASRHVAEYQEKMKIKPENGGSESKLGKAPTEELVSHLKSVVYTKVSEICEYVRERFGVSYIPNEPKD